MLIESLRSGAWVTQRRLRGYPLIYFVVFVVLTVGALVLGQGPLDPSGKPLGTDFLSLWSAANLTWQGRPAAAYDHDALQAIEHTVAAPGYPLYTWLYPPTALLVILPVAAFPYLPALGLWVSTTFLAYLSALWRLLPEPRAILPMVAFPGVFLNLGHGQNAFLTAALLGWGLILLPRRPWLAGALMGIQIYKPQLGILLPVALVAAGHWRALGGAMVSALALIALSLGLWGTEVWWAFLAKTDYARLVLEEGLVAWPKMITTFAAARMLGATTDLAWMLQTTSGLLAALAVAWVWSRPLRPQSQGCRIAALIAGTMLAAPLALDYEATLLGLAIAVLVAEGRQQGFLCWEISLLAFAWLSPIAWRPLAYLTALPLGWLTMLMILGLAVRRAAWLERRGG